MPLRRKIAIRSFNSVGAGQTATLNVPVSGRYFDITLKYTESGSLVTVADMKTAITDIRLLVNGVEVRRHSATELFAIMEFYGQKVNDGFINLFFAEPWARNAESEDVFAWGMRDVQNFQIEVDIASGRTAPALSATATKDLVEQNLGNIKKYRKYTVPVAATGITNFPTLPTIDAYTTMHAFSGVMDDVLVRVDNQEIYDLTIDEANDSLKQRGFVPQSNVFHINFNEVKRGENLLPMVNRAVNPPRTVQEFQIDFNMNTATSFDLITETIGRV